MSLINKYRPRYFKEVVGQDQIVKTLVQSIKKNKIHNAYLFAGKYGTGKTTLARLLAVALNCEHFKNDICEDCATTKVNNFDIIEIDAASNRGIDEVRKLKENSYKKPWGKYRIYIIDEAHQLTSQAGNALLKVLEEPSSSTKFMFCTTEPMKLLNTIKSRCLSFYTRPIRFTDIKNRLKYITDKEGIKYKDDRIFYTIANQSNNTMRDAINYLEIALNNTEEELTIKILEESLNIVNEKDVYDLLDYLIQKNFNKFFDVLYTLNANGKRYEDIVSTVKYQAKEILFIKKGWSKGVNKYKIDKLKNKNYPLKVLYQITKDLTELESLMSGYVNPKDNSELKFLKIMLQK
jgi:DNA polymerase-3 subunit gamma/tau